MPIPYRGNDILKAIAHTSCKGNMIYLTATPDEELLQRVKEGSLVCLKLNKRPHGKPIPVPKKIIGPKVFLFLQLLKWLKDCEDHPRIIFVPTIQKAMYLSQILSLLMDCYVCTSKSEDRDVVIRKFREEQNGIMIATTVLERGVTIPHCDVCVLEAQHDVFDEAGLVQMAGRAGRDFNDPYGDVLFLCNEKSKKVDDCIQSILEANDS